MPTLILPPGSPDNFTDLYIQARPYEIVEGATYYRAQQHRLTLYATAYSISLSQIVGTFAVLSPNNSEYTNYIALENAIGIHLGLLPPSTKVQAYPANRIKALKILAGPVDQVPSIISGPKITAFYYNTLHPGYTDHVTIDGHMLNAWANTHYNLKAMAHAHRRYYNMAKADLITAATSLGYHPSSFQAIIWLVWKRINRIVSNPQMRLSTFLHPLGPDRLRLNGARFTHNQEIQEWLRSQSDRSRRNSPSESVLSKQQRTGSQSRNSRNSTNQSSESVRQQVLF